MGLRRNFLLFPGGRQRALTFSYDDAVTQDVRFVELLNHYRLKGTFNINTGLLGQRNLHEKNGKPVTHDKLSPAQIPQIYRGHELAVHGLTHLDLALAGPAAAAYEISEDRHNLEEITKTPVRGMAYPFGTYTDELILLLRCSGIEYSRTVESTGAFGLPRDFLLWHPTCHHGDGRLFSLAEAFLEPEQEYSGPRLFYVWGHTYEFDENDDWDRMEQFLRTVSGKKEIWYATNIEICDYVNAAGQLRYSASGQYIFNPSALDVWMQLGGKTVLLPAGKTTDLHA